MAFVERLINVGFSLTSGVGSSSTIKGKRVSCKIVNAGSPSMGTADVTIYGLPLSMMNQLTTLGTQINFINKNSITIEAGDAQSGMSLIFKGTISLAYVDAQAQPEVAFRISAYAGMFGAVESIQPTSIETDTDVSQVMQSIATQMNLGFENNGVNVKIGKQYLSGSGRDQLLTLAEAAGIQFTIENDVVVIWNTGQARTGDSVLISPQTGMVGYPAFNQAGVIVRTIFNKSLRYGGKINVQSELTPAVGTWNINNLGHDIESQVPNGQWFSIVQGYREGTVTP